MRGTDLQQGGMFSYVSLESRVPASHPLRGIKELLDEALASMSRDFERVYASEGRPSIPPERLVRASTLQILYSIRSERLLCEQLDYNLLFRSAHDSISVPSTLKCSFDNSRAAPALRWTTCEIGCAGMQDLTHRGSPELRKFETHLPITVSDVTDCRKADGDQ